MHTPTLVSNTFLHSRVAHDCSLDATRLPLGPPARGGLARRLYPGCDPVVCDVLEGPAASMSIEPEWCSRLILRGMGVDAGQTDDETCAVPFPDPPAEPRKVVGSLPPGLAKLRIR